MPAGLTWMRLDEGPHLHTAPHWQLSQETGLDARCDDNSICGYMTPGGACRVTLPQTKCQS